MSGTRDASIKSPSPFSQDYSTKREFKSTLSTIWPPTTSDSAKQLLKTRSKFSNSLNPRFARLIAGRIGLGMRNSRNAVLMALDDTDNLVASIEVAKRGINCGRISMIAVNERYQKGGVGRSVLAYAESYCRQTWNVEKFSLNALSTRKTLIEWYMRQGYQKTGETSPFPRERFTSVALPDDICFIEMEKDFSSGEEGQSV